MPTLLDRNCTVSGTSAPDDCAQRCSAQCHSPLPSVLMTIGCLTIPSNHRVVGCHSPLLCVSMTMECCRPSISFLAAFARSSDLVMVSIEKRSRNLGLALHWGVSASMLCVTVTARQQSLDRFQSKLLCQETEVSRGRSALI